MKPNISEKEINDVVDVLKAGWFTYGEKNEEFEKLFANYIGVKRAVSVNSCTSALFLSLLARGIKTGDEVLVPAFTFVATANAVLHCGAKPVFVDSNLDTFNIDIDDAKQKITEKTKAIIPVHYAGLTCDMARLSELAGKNNLHIVEDVAQSLGAEFGGKKAGSFGLGCFSFFSTKHITTGEGGMVTTDEDVIADKVLKFAGHGIDKSTWARSYAKYPWERIQSDLGFNFRMTNFQAAMGIGQLKRINENIENRIRIANKITKFLEQFDFIVPQDTPDNHKHSYHMYTARVVGKDRRTFLEKLREAGIGASVHYDPPVHLQPFYTNLFGRISLPVAEEISKSIITLPLYPEMTDEELGEMFGVIEQVCREMK